MSNSAPTTNLPAWDRWFHLTERGSTLSTEIRGGIVTFVTMAYIVVLNPLIIGTVQDKNGHLIDGTCASNKFDALKNCIPVPPGESVPFSPSTVAVVAAATALIAGLMSIFMGIYGRFPVALATGLGLNSFLAYNIASQMSWPAALGLMVIGGLLMFILVLTGFRIAVFRAVPQALKYAIGTGIGLFIAFIGLVDAGIVRSGIPIVSFGLRGELAGWPMFTFVFGLVLLSVLVALRVKAGILIGLISTVVLAVVIEKVANIGPMHLGSGGMNDTGWGLNVPKIGPLEYVSPTTLFHLDLTSGFKTVGLLSGVILVFTLLLSDFFDTMGTVTGLANEADLLNENGEVEHLAEILVVDSVAVMAGGVAGTSSNTAYIESASGIGDGARTGIASIVTGLLFLLAIFVSPLARLVPYEAAAPALIIVGFLMMTQVRKINFDDYSVAIPAFLTIILMPFTYSITNGIGAGIVSYVIIKLAQRKLSEIPAILWVIFIAFVAYFAVNPIQQLIN